MPENGKETYKHHTLCILGYVSDLYLHSFTLDLLLHSWHVLPITYASHWVSWKTLGGTNLMQDLRILV